MKVVPKNLVKSSKSYKGNGSKQKNMAVEGDEKIEEEEDRSVLRQPVDIGIRGVRDLIKAVSEGTHEFQELLLNECAIIYECKVCRNLFRSLANFISHKRVYCTGAYSHFTHGLSDLQTHSRIAKSELSDVVQPEMPQDNEECKQGNDVWVTSDKTVDNTESNNGSSSVCTEIKVQPVRITRKRDIAKIIEGLNRRGGKEIVRTSGDIPDSMYYADIAERVMMRRNAREKDTIEFESVSGSSNGVFQTVKHSLSDSTVDSIKLQLVELETVVAKNQAILQEDGKFTVALDDQSKDANIIYRHTCSYCDSKFVTVKTLRRHVKIHHNEQICYPCPLCKVYFASPSSVYRHLSKIHHRSEQQIRRLRPHILSKATKRKLEQESPKMTAETTTNEWGNHFEDPLRCTKCGKVFNRRAVLSVHSASCKEVPVVKSNSQPSVSKSVPSEKTQPRFNECKINTSQTLSVDACTNALVLPPTADALPPESATPLPVTKTVLPPTRKPIPARDIISPAANKSSPVMETVLPVTNISLASETDLPVDSKPSLIVDTVLPVTSEPSPVVDTALPVTSKLSPIVDAVVLATSKSFPVMDTNLPVTSKQCPVVDTVVPMTSKSSLVVDTVLPVTSQPSPVSGTVLSATINPTLVVDSVLPATSKHPNVSDKVLSMTSKSSPVVETVVPLTSNHATVMEIVLPAARKPSPVVDTIFPKSKKRPPVMDNILPVTSQPSFRSGIIVRVDYDKKIASNSKTFNSSLLENNCSYTEKPVRKVEVVLQKLRRRPTPNRKEKSSSRETSIERLGINQKSLHTNERLKVTETQDTTKLIDNGPAANNPVEMLQDQDGISDDNGHRDSDSTVTLDDDVQDHKSRTYQLRKKIRLQKGPVENTQPEVSISETPQSDTVSSKPVVDETLKDHSNIKNEESTFVQKTQLVLRRTKRARTVIKNKEYLYNLKKLPPLSKCRTKSVKKAVKQLNYNGSVLLLHKNLPLLKNGGNTKLLKFFPRLL